MVGVIHQKCFKVLYIFLTLFALGAFFTTRLMASADSTIQNATATKVILSDNTLDGRFSYGITKAESSLGQNVYAWVAGKDYYAAFVPQTKNWSDFEILRLKIFSPTNSGAVVWLMFNSQPVNTGLAAGNYFMAEIRLDWNGWKTLDLPFSSLRTVRTPAGWHKIDNISFTSKYGSTTPKADLKLYFGGISLISFRPINVKPTIVSQPSPQIVTEGEKATFSAVATGIPAPSYQWFKNGLAIVGADRAEYQVDVATASHNGSIFNLEISNVAGNITSNSAELTVHTFPKIVTHPVSKIVTIGHGATFSVSCTGNPTPRYQWYKNGISIDNATGAAYTTPIVSSVKDNATFFVELSNICGVVQSTSANLSVYTIPEIAVQPESKMAIIGEVAKFSVVAQGHPEPSYQWCKNGVEILGATSSTYTIPATAIRDDGSNYMVLVTNSVATVPSNSATLNVSPAKIYYVSLDGADTNDGTLEKPFANLESARDAIRNLKKQPSGLPMGGVKVLVAPGNYRREGTFSLSALDSGTEMSPIVYAGSLGGNTTMTGATRLQSSWFAPVTDSSVLARVISPAARSGLLQCDLNLHGISDYGVLSRRGFSKANLGIAPPMGLYINGERMMLARWPNPGEASPTKLNNNLKGMMGVVCRSGIIDMGPTGNDPDFLNRGGIISYAFDRPSLWGQAKDVWLDGVFSKSWAWSYNKIATVDTAKQHITLAYGEMYGIAQDYAGDYFFAENLLEEIDSAGEYYIDREFGRLYILPPKDFMNPNTVIAVSTLKTPLVNINGTSFVTLKNLTLDTGRSSGIYCIGGEGNRIVNCEIRNTMGTAITLIGKNHGVVSCHIHQVGGVGVSITGGNLDTLEPGLCFADNNHIHNVAVYNKVYQPAISVSGVGNRLAHNRIHNAPHVGISAFGNDQMIEGNEIYDVCKEFIDMGAIYLNLGERPLQRGTLIRRNYLYDIGLVRGGQVGVYLDTSTMGVTIEENIFRRIGNSYTPAVLFNAGPWNKVRHNIFIDCSLPLRIDSHAITSANIRARLFSAWQATDFIKQPHAQRYPELLTFWSEDRESPDTNRYEYNVIWNPNRSLSKNVGTLPVLDGAADDFRKLIPTGNWVTEGDPGFVEDAQGLYSFRDSTEVFTRIPGFPKISFSVANRSPASDNLMAWYKMDDMGSALIDSSSRANHGVLSDSSTTTGILDRALVSSYGGNIIIPDSDLLSFGNGETDQPFSMSFWVKFSNVGVYQQFCKKGAYPDHGEYALQLSPTNFQYRLYGSSKFIWIGGQVSNPFVNNTWSHVVFTYNGAKVFSGTTLYINGQQVSTVESSFNAVAYTGMTNTSHPLTIKNAVSPSASFDDFRLFNKALTSREVLDLYQVR